VYRPEQMLVATGIVSNGTNTVGATAGPGVNYWNGGAGTID
jgi:hypothetical protein